MIYTSQTFITETDNLEQSIASLLKPEADVDYDYFLAALAARLMFISKSKTPVYFPITAEKSDTLIEKLITDCTVGVTHFVIAPATEENCARLVVISKEKGEAKAAVYQGRSIYEYLTEEACR